jgi:hypothetical protein
MSKDKIDLDKHMAALRQADKELGEERDRRYAEVALARAEALRIKEVADEKALDLAREIQKYKDEKANELREQIAAERGTYLPVEIYNDRNEELVRRITKNENLLSQGGGRSTGLNAAWGYLLGAVTLIASIIAIYLVVSSGQ